MEVEFGSHSAEESTLRPMVDCTTVITPSYGKIKNYSLSVKILAINQSDIITVWNTCL